MTAEPMNTHDGRNVVPLRRRDQAPRLFKGDVQEVEEYLEDEDVLEGEVVDEEVEWSELPALHRAAVVVRETVTSDAARAAARQASYLVVGASVTRRRWKDARGGRYERMMTAAELAGDHEAVLKWAELAAQSAADRHSRRLERAASWGRHVERLPTYAKASAGTLGGLGVLMAIATKDAAAVATPFLTIAELVQWSIHCVSILWGPALVATPLLGLLALWVTGMRHAETSEIGWVRALSPGEGGDGEMIVTADGIVTALQHLRIPEMKKAFKEGWVPKMHLTPVRDGLGYHAVVELPLGVTAEMVADLRPVLARNLHRAEIETWPADAEKARTGPAGALDLWIADSGALSKNAPEYPLMHTGTADVFEGVPVGVSPRGDLITVPLVSNNFVAGGMMGQGKSNACRVLMLGAALDPLARLWVHVFAGNGDFDAYVPRLERYHRGTEDDVVEAGLESLRDLYEETGRREARLAELGAKKVTRHLAAEHADLRPICALFSECHELFGHKEYGPEAVELAVRTIRRARKTGIWLGFDTQDARKDAIPPKIVGLVSINACFYVKSWRANDGFLGDGSFQAGIRATELRPGRDRGTSLITGTTDAMFELLKWYFVEVDDDTGWDAATDVIARAMTKVDPKTPVEATAAPREIEQPRDLLEDLDEVLGRERVRLADVPARLRDLAPRWRPYQNLTAKELKEILKAEGIKVPNPGNVPHLDPADVRAEISRRSTADLDDQDW